MKTITAVVLIALGGTIGSAMAQEAPVYGLDYNPPLLRSQHDSRESLRGYPGRQMRSAHIGGSSSRQAGPDTQTTSSINQPSRTVGGNYGSQVTDWELKSGR